MPPPKTYDKQKMSLEDARVSVRFSRGKLRRHSLTTAFVAVFQSLLDDIDAVAVQSKAIEDEINDAQIDIYVADDGLNDFATEIWRAIEIIGDPAVRNLFFSDKTLSEFNRPILNDQFKTMEEAWPGYLEGTEHPALQALAPKLAPLLELARAAIKRRGIADAARKAFREVGERAKVFDKVNIARRKLWTDLSEIATKTPDLNKSFPDRFFRREAPDSDVVVEEPTVESLTKEIEDLQNLARTKQAQIDDLKKKAELAETEARDRKSKEDRLKQLDEEQAARDKEREQILADLAKKPPPETE